MVGPIISGAMTEDLGFRSFWWLNTGIIGLSFLMVVFMFPETRFQREELLAIIPTKQHSSADSSSEKANATTTENIASSEDGNITHIDTATSTHPAPAKNLTPIDTAARDPYLGAGRPGREPEREARGVGQTGSHGVRGYGDADGALSEEEFGTGLGEAGVYDF